jgi:hypothetical protein
MDKEEIIKLIRGIDWTDDDAISNCDYDDQPNDAFDKGAAWMKEKIISIIGMRGN